jgi:hypothetical protein
MRDAVTNRRRPDPELLRGSVITLRRRCGKPNCRCATGEPHETPALSFSQAGRTRTLTLREHDLAEVEAALARYRAARDDLEQRAAAGVEALAARLAARREQARR